jgi:hypothetical protein
VPKGQHRAQVTVVVGDEEEMRKLSLDVPELPPEPEELEGGRDAVGCKSGRCSAKLTADAFVLSAPPGWTLSVEGMLRPGNTFTLPLPPDEVLARRSLIGGDVEVRFMLQPPGATALHGAVFKSVSVPTIDTVLEGIPGKGLALPGDGSTPKPPRTLVEIDGSTKNSYGDPTTLRDLDLVAIRTSKTVEGTCGTYQGRDGTTERIEKNLYHEQVDVYDRRTGARVQSRFFRAPPEACPTTIQAGRTLSSFVPDKDIHAYLEGLLR